LTDPSRVLPVDPLAFIRSCVQERKLLWTYHVQMRLEGRSVPRAAVLDLADAQVIESYPDDKYLPSYLVLTRHSGVVFHILFAVDVPGSNVRVVTTYRPDPTEWESDFRTRRHVP